MTARHVVRGIEHLGITVPNIDEAVRFFSDAFGAELIYELRSPDDPDTEELAARERARLGTRSSARWRRSQLLRLGEGPTIELFEYDDRERLEPPTPSDLGLQHFAVYVDDIDDATARVVAAGGTALEGPSESRGLESGAGNRWIYTLAPWGGVVELITYPSAQPYEELTELRRWRPPRREETP